MNPNKGKKVFVGMSGGVDSSVSALLLKLAGYDVTGVFIKVWQPENGECTWKDERRDAMRVAAALDIPFLTFDFGERYKRDVVDYMIDEYKQGRTPNPDVMCNRQIKFGSFLDEALKMGADYIATGHYAMNIETSNPDNTKTFQLHESNDKSKDQSYFLWTLTERDLEHVLFPIGHLQKSEVRKIAEQHKLPVFDKKDSQGICFLGHVDMKEFLKEYIDTEKGNVIDEKGTVIGEHDGSLLYTIGERHGFRLFVNRPDDTPHYIISKDSKNNTITVVPQDVFQKGEFMPTEITISSVNLPVSIDYSKQYTARLRYRQEPQPCNIKKSSKNDKEVIIEFIQPQLAITPGQSLVLYDGETCLGGGILNSYANRIY